MSSTSKGFCYNIVNSIIERIYFFFGKMFIQHTTWWDKDWLKRNNNFVTEFPQKSPIAIDNSCAYLPLFPEPPIAARKRDYKIVALGQDVQLLCPINGHNGITWIKGSETINDYAWERFSYDKKSLMIHKVQHDDMGIYYCKGTNGFGSAEVRIDLFVTEHGQNYNAIKPALTEQTRDITEFHYPKTGSNLDLLCEALGQPEPSIYWLKNNKQISRNNGLLELTDVKNEDTAVYTCYAQNTIGHASKNFTVQVVSDANDLDQSYTPDFSAISHLTVPNNPENTTVEQGGSAILECTAKVCILSFEIK